MTPWQQATHRKPDRIFATCEGGPDGGIKGSITEYRYGLKATIALDLEYGAGIRQAWLLPLNNPPSFEGYLLFLSMPDFTAGLQVPSDFSSATPVDSGTVPYDLSSTTLALVTSGHFIIQITRKSIVLATQQARYGQNPTPDMVIETWSNRKALTWKQPLVPVPGSSRTLERFCLGRLRP